MHVPLIDLKAQYASISQEIDVFVQDILGTQEFVGGPYVRVLEHKAAAHCRVGFGVGVSSGTDAILAALMALGVGAGDEVITSPFAFGAAAMCVARLGARPVFADIDAETFTLDPAGVEARVGPRTRAVLPVHLFGQCADMDPILEMAGRRGLAVVEDGSQAVLAECRGRRAGSMGDAGCFSFYPTRSLGGLGNGGMVVTNRADLAERLRLLRDHGADAAQGYKLVGGDFRLGSITAAILSLKFDHIERWIARRQHNAEDYGRLLAEAGLAGREVTPPVVKREKHVFDRYVVRCRDRDALRAHLAERGVETAVYYPRPLHLEECFRDLGGRAGDFPRSEEACATVLALPMYAELRGAQRAYVVEQMAGFYRGVRPA